MTLDKIIYDVREGVRQYTDDSEISDRYIIYLYNIHRADYLRQDLNNYQRTSDNSIKQTFCIDLVEVSNNECNIDIECDTILRSSKPIPTPLELHTKVALTSVKPTNRTAIPFNFVTKRRITMLNGARFKKSLYSFLDEDGYIYVTAPEGNEFKLLNCLTITGIFEDPLSLIDFTNCCGCDTATSCFDMATTNYPLQPHYIKAIRKEIINNLLQFLGVQEDKTNNDND